MAGDESASRTERNMLYCSRLHFVQMCMWTQPPASLRLQDRKPNKRQDDESSLKSSQNGERWERNRAKLGTKASLPTPPLAPRLAQC